MAESRTKLNSKPVDEMLDFGQEVATLRIDGPDRFIFGTIRLQQGFQRAIRKPGQHVEFRKLANTHAEERSLEYGVAAVATPPAIRPEWTV